MHNRSDQFSKNLLRDGLSLVSAAETEVEVLAATQKIDVYSVPDPAREAERAGMGLLGELAAEPSLFEPFHRTPSLRQVRRCLRKQLTWHHELERRARSAAGSVAPDEDTDAPPQPAVDFPALVVIGTGRPETVLDAYRCEPVQPGVYHAVPGLVMRVVVLAELPRTRGTLLLRLLGSGRLLRDALADLAELPDDAWERSIAQPLLVHFRLGGQEPTTDEEDEVSAEIRAWFEDYERKLRSEERTEGRREGRDEGRREGRDEGRAEEAARAVLTVLRGRGIAVPDVARERILAEKDLQTLERWIERAVVAASLAEVLDGPS
ncbi:uncharacterized protein SOCE26_092730 [Sorangium cellulosum]|uniref:Uncharacterized protein n=1 Tax=Sorangium cellulosum TaxID=56 RepID=A0A2L0F8I4_SORCE|nr:hypothetical protein [Sorangium cellulosum]AUX47749.1 uncharacterized protein SOCE26_092730 [Sorangium cellulosum]